MSNSQPVALVVGASRGIGRQVAIDLAKNGYTVVVAAKTTSDPAKLSSTPPDPNSPASTITTVAHEINLAGGRAVAIQVDTRSPESINSLISQTISSFSRLDVLVYNSGAIFWASVAKTPFKRFQLMQQVNVEGLYATIQAALPHMYPHGRIVVVSPPIYSRFFRGKTAYAMGKVGMSVLTKGLGMDFVREGRDAQMSITSIWPAVAIESAATQQFKKKPTDPTYNSKENDDEEKDYRKATIFSDAILAILRADPKVVNGQLLLDEDFLRHHAGVTDFSQYNVVPGSNPRRIMPKILPDLTVAEQDDEGKRVDSTAKARGSKL